MRAVFPGRLVLSEMSSSLILSVVDKARNPMQSEIIFCVQFVLSFASNMFWLFVEILFYWILLFKNLTDHFSLPVFRCFITWYSVIATSLVLGYYYIQWLNADVQHLDEDIQSLKWCTVRSSFCYGSSGLSKIFCNCSCHKYFNVKKF